MLTIQYVFRDVYFSIKNILRKLYRSCAVFVSGVAMLALLVLNEQSFPGTGKDQILITSRIGRDAEQESEEENNLKWLISEDGFVMAYQNFLKDEQGRVKQELQLEISKREVTAVCASIEPARNEIQLEPLNPYGEIVVSERDYDALCRIVQAEAGGEDGQGKILVAEVILNRVLSEKFAHSVYEVIFETNGGRPQFSPTVDGRYFSVTVMPETIEAVEQALHGKDLSQGALFFSARSKANPYDMEWFDRNLKWLFQHGGHEFYTLP